MRNPILEEPGATLALWGLGVSFLSVLISAVGTAVLIIRLPVDAFLGGRAPVPRSWPRRILRVLRNGLGWGIILLGLVLLIPGVPGQGLLTVALGLLLVDVPGKSRLLRKLLSHEAVRRSMDRLRIRFGRPPFQWTGP